MPEENEKIYCQYCEWWVDRAHLIFWTGDDAVHFLCPGCDADMVFPILAVDDWYEMVAAQHEAKRDDQG